MTILADDTLPKFGAQDSLDDGSTIAIADNTFSVLADIAPWTNDEDAPFANFVLKCQFDTTPPTEGAIDLYARPMNLESTSDPETPDDNFKHEHIDSFPIDFGVAADVDFYTFIVGAMLPLFQSSQILEFYLKNNNTGQTIGAEWRLWISPYTYGPKA